MLESLLNRITVIIPQWNEWELTVNCVGSLRRQFGNALEIIVVDDGSSQQVLDWTARFLSNACTVKSQDHLGVSKAWNFGTRETRDSSEYFVFLNNDVITCGDWISPMISSLMHKTVVMTGMKSRTEKRLPELMVSRLPTSHFLEGWCMAVRRSEFESLNGFDERMAVYWSDTDFQLRLYKEKLSGDDKPILKTIDCDFIKHLGHRTSKTMADKSKRWNRDRNVFLSIWG